jgi:ribosome maturation factor RimP
MLMKKDALIEKIEALVKPITDELNYELYHVEYVKENGE